MVPTKRSTKMLLLCVLAVTIPNARSESVVFSRMAAVTPYPIVPNWEWTLAQVLDKLENSESAIDTVSVSCRGTGKWDSAASFHEGAEVERFRYSVACSWWCRTDGTWLFTNTNRDDSTTLFSSLTPLGRGRYRIVNADTDETLREDSLPEGSLGTTSHQIVPLEFLSNWNRKRITEYLEEEKVVVLGTQERDGRALTIVEVTETTIIIGLQYRHVFWVDMERGVAPIREMFMQRDKLPWKLTSMLECSNYSMDIKSGLWLPGNAKSFSWEMNNNGENYRLVHAGYHLLSEWRINAEIPDSHPLAKTIDSLRVSPESSSADR